MINDNKKKCENVVETISEKAEKSGKFRKIYKNPYF
jgi:hypothetical protein